MQSTLPAIGADFPTISTIFDTEHGTPHSLLYRSSVKNALLRLLPPHFFLSEIHADSSEQTLRQFIDLLPIVKWSQWGESPYNISIFLLCRHRVNAVKFFYEMISRWLLPGKRPYISSFFSTDFRFPDLSEEVFTISEIVLSIEEKNEVESIYRQLPILESEIHLGLISVYHANRILEIKGLSADEKTSLIQERISSILERRPRDFDHDIFTQMQHFLVMCSDEFKTPREFSHMSRIIYVFYLFRKAISEQVEKNPGQRFVNIKLSKTLLHLPLGMKKVLAIFIGLNFLNESELFEQRHLKRILKNHFPGLHVVEGSYFSHHAKEDRVQLLYLEVEKGNGQDFSLEEVKRLKKRLPDEVHAGIEKLTRPIFMPRNEEEVIRNIITLSNQLKFFRDLPQVVLSFDEQIGADLSFTVIWLRILKPQDLSLQEQFKKKKSFLRFASDRIKKVGTLRKKYPKEATVFRVQLSSHPFLRPDHSVDLFKVRQAIVEELQQIFGEFRDFNGGMMAKQHEQYISLKNLFTHLSRKEELLLENFFHSIYPIELRSLFDPQPLKNLFDVLLSTIQKNKDNSYPSKVFIHLDKQYCYFLLSYDSSSLKEEVIERIKHLQIPSSQLLTVSLQAFETYYLGYVYREEGPEKRERFINTMRSFVYTQAEL